MTTRTRPVLVVEDSDDDFDTVGVAAGRARLQQPVRRAHSGDECMALLQGGSGQGLRPSIILMDLNTPGVDGREALALIKSDPSLREIPVIVLTTSNADRDVAHCYQVGANAYHVKPVQYPEHLTTVVDIFEYWLGTALLAEETEGVS